MITLLYNQHTRTIVHMMVIMLVGIPMCRPQQLNFCAVCLDFEYVLAPRVLGLTHSVVLSQLNQNRGMDLADVQVSYVMKYESTHNMLCNILSFQIFKWCQHLRGTTISVSHYQGCFLHIIIYKSKHYRFRQFSLLCTDPGQGASTRANILLGLQVA